MTRVPGNVVNWLSPLGVKLKETLIEDSIVGGVQLISQSLVALISRKHWLKDSLGLEHGFHLVLKNLLLDIYLALFICEQEFSDFKFVDLSESLAERRIVNQIGVQEHLDLVADPEGLLLAISVLSFHMIRPWNVLRELE